MSKKVYISPSDQISNKYAYGDTNEHVQCEKIGKALAAALERCGISTKMATQSQTMAQRCKASDGFGADIHICVHTNAYNKAVMGTRLFCYNKTGKGYKACQAVFKQLAPLSPGTSENISVNANLYEVREPAAPTVYCECEFHDTETGAKWIVEHTTEIGEAIAHGLCDYFGVTYKAASKAEEKPATEEKTTILYRVQVGAFSVKANAEKLLEKLKKAGFGGYIVASK